MQTARTLVALVALAITASACSSDDNKLDQRVLDAEAQGNAAGTAVADVAATELTGDQAGIVIGKTATILRTLNEVVIAEASFATTVVQTTAVRNYAAMIVENHTGAEAMLDMLVRGAGAAFLPSATAAQISAAGSAALAELRATPAQDVDLAFMQLMVSQHAAGLVILDELAAQVGPGPVGDFIAAARGVEQNHLTGAELLLDTF